MIIIRKTPCFCKKINTPACSFYLCLTKLHTPIVLLKLASKRRRIFHFVDYIRQANHSWSSADKLFLCVSP